MTVVERRFGEARPVEARRLVKRYGGVAAVDGVDLTVEAGGICGFLGPNGAGKTTTLRILLGLVRRESGSVRLFGRDPGDDVIGALDGVAGFIEEPRLYSYLSGRANPELLAAFDRSGAGRAAIGEVLDVVDLRGRADDRVGEYSQGMRQRLGIASCLIRRPRLLLLDEPANGVDPAGIRDMRGLLRRLSDEGITILLSSHLLAEVEEVCDRVAIIDRGRIVYAGSLADLDAGAARRYRLGSTDPERALTACGTVGVVGDLRLDGDAVTFIFNAPQAAVELTRALAASGVGITSLVRERETLEQLFFRLTDRDQQSERLEAAVR